MQVVQTAQLACRQLEGGTDGRYVLRCSLGTSFSPRPPGAAGREQRAERPELGAHYSVTEVPWAGAARLTPLRGLGDKATGATLDSRDPQLDRQSAPQQTHRRGASAGPPAAG